MLQSMAVSHSSPHSPDLEAPQEQSIHNKQLHAAAYPVSEAEQSDLRV